ncbi:uncharacterized protein CIMG_12858 [Coccidioides immitis RS]|uniref:Uncharacterized protein n=1 Tax=Coccidioides immitis (strain RS) TaxID=246410 RepID=J3KHB3_COCIM|nr:uncharacterized protein CIMG_12858 [Coccidioides immitis RS]EAS35228.3 hypothetical protein CIMG_12858 [Coccidioides immitis RS]
MGQYTIAEPTGQPYEEINEERIGSDLISVSLEPGHFILSLLEYKVEPWGRRLKVITLNPSVRHNTDPVCAPQAADRILIALTFRLLRPSESSEAVSKLRDVDRLGLKTFKSSDKPRS